MREERTVEALLRPPRMSLQRGGQKNAGPGVRMFRNLRCCIVGIRRVCHPSRTAAGSAERPRIHGQMVMGAVERTQTGAPVKTASLRDGDASTALWPELSSNRQ
jgi:hypothetical protein